MTAWLRCPDAPLRDKQQASVEHYADGTTKVRVACRFGSAEGSGPTVEIAYAAAVEAALAMAWEARERWLNVLIEHEDLIGRLAGDLSTKRDMRERRTALSKEEEES